MRDFIQEIYQSLRLNKLRTALTGFAVAWGIFMLIVLLGAGNGVLNALLDNSDRMENSMVAYSGRTTLPYGGFEKNRPIRFDERDVDALKLGGFGPFVDDVCPAVRQSVSLTYGENYFSCSLMGVSPVFQQIQKIEILSGRFVNAQDLADRRKCVVVGSSEVEQLLGRGAAPARMLGRWVKIGPFSYKVVGVYQSDESRGGDNVQVFAPFSTVSTIYAKGRDIPMIYFSFHGIETEEQNTAFEKSFGRGINIRHSADPEDTGTVFLWNRLTSSQSLSKVVRTIRTALWILGLFTLLSGIVGVSNIMLITVKERTHEFGIRKAIGARPGSILSLIITESIAITAFFGYLGMILGLVANEVMDKTIAGRPVDAGIFQATIFKNPTVGLDVAIGATLVLIIAGTIAGLVPAWKASRVKPIEALRAGK